MLPSGCALSTISLPPRSATIFSSSSFPSPQASSSSSLALILTISSSLPPSHLPPSLLSLASRNKVIDIDTQQIVHANATGRSGSLSYLPPGCGAIGLGSPSDKNECQIFSWLASYDAVRTEVVNAHDGRRSRIGGVYIYSLLDVVVLDWRSFKLLFHLCSHFFWLSYFPLLSFSSEILPSLSTPSTSVSCSLFRISFHFLLF